MTASRGATGAARRGPSAGTEADSPRRPGLLTRLTEASGPGLVMVFALAVAVRLAPLLRTHALTGILGPDDGSLFSASAHLLHGALPYRDITFGEPPGIAVLLLPFTALATVVGDVTGLTVARCAFVLLGAVNAVLVSVSLRRVAPRWAVPAGILYATWRLSASAERTVALEPVLTFGLLAGLILLGADVRGTNPPPRRMAASGAALGLAVATTLWAGPPALLVAGYTLATRGLRAATVWAGGALAAFAIIAGPLAATAPREFAKQAVLGPLRRATAATLSDRLLRFSDVVRLGSYELPASVDIMIATCVVVALAALALTAWWQPGARLIVLLLVLQCTMVATAPDYSGRRFAAAPTLVLAAGIAAHQLLPDPWTGRLRQPLRALLVLTTSALTLLAVHNVVPRPPDARLLRSFAAEHRCVWFDSASVAIFADALTPLLDHGCPVPVDRLADLQSFGEQLEAVTPAQARRSEGLQLRLNGEIDDSDAVVLPTDDDDGTVGEDLLNDVHEHYTLVGTVGDLGLWLRRP